MKYRRMPIEIESPEQLGYDTIKNNLSESSYTDAFLRETGIADAGLQDLLLCYGPHAGHEGLRELVVQGSPDLDKQDVLLTIGAAGALFIIASTLLEAGDELVVVTPNYATNIETPRAIGASIRFVDLQFDDGFALDSKKLRQIVTPKTKYISVTYPHNPTGVCLSDMEMKELVSVAQENNAWLLVDETYRDMVFGEKLPMAAAYGDRVISVSSLSKAYGLPGIRMGWIVCRNQQLMETFLAAKEQIHICGSVLDEEVAFRYMQHRSRHFEKIGAAIREKFGIVKTWMNGQDGFEWVEPAGGCVCFPRVRRPASVDMKRFYEILLGKYETYVGPGHWFDMPKHYMRIGFGWPAKMQLAEGLTALGKSLEEAHIG
jgi:aspartate/methionine/tyrosine aminotransferase